MPNEKESGRYPNDLRSHRVRACLTRKQLSDLTGCLEAKDSVRFTGVSVAAVKALELGWTRPRPRTAASLAEVLSFEPLTVFNSGIDDSVRNPSGKTRVALARDKG